MAGHGMIINAKQVLLLNQFNAYSGFYKFWGAEGDVRDIAESYRNSYSMVFFACCRELFIPHKHTNGFGGTEAEA